MAKESGHPAWILFQNCRQPPEMHKVLWNYVTSYFKNFYHVIFKKSISATNTLPIDDLIVFLIIISLRSSSVPMFNKM
jgi:hypothetical protein